MHKALQFSKKDVSQKAIAADSYLHGKREIKELGGRYLKRHFQRYGRETGLALLGKPFKNHQEYVRESIKLRQNPKVKVMLYNWRGKKPSLGFFLEKPGKFIFEPLNLKEYKIKTFRMIKKKELNDSKLFNELYRVC